VVIEAQVEGSTIPETVAMETVAGGVESVIPVDEVPEGAAPCPESPVAPEVIEGVHIDVLPESSLDVVVRSPEIQDAEPIRAAPMSKIATTSRD
jgi:Ni,Fe-hydrogenase III small subunit